ncbi:MAG TPA: hypothetical protein VGI39_30175 [Polyangiaceae bacterium]
MAKVLEATPFREGMTIQVGWTRFMLRTQAGRVIVCEPSFQGNPFAAANLDVTLSLAVLSAHDEMIQVLGIGPEPVSFHHSVLIERGCLSERRVFMQRTRASEGDDSGWCVARAGKAAPTESSDDAEWIRATELLRVRRPLVIPLILPAGYAVDWDGDAIVSLRDGSEAKPWPSKAAEVLREGADRLEWAWSQATSHALPS